ncbi:hypothetical protein ACN2XU_15510 [Primorskyibacter sp. 2E107]|uniref:hypothetical protein n=1 Tax=Primorskyibacter sp. 2E107 TaxID=3403458 RepID=UPI003AF92BDE
MARTSDLTALQNQYRGIVAALRSTGFSEVKKSNELARQYWTSLKSLFFAAREKLHSEKFQEFMTWVDSQESTLLTDIRGLPKGYEQLAGVADSKPVDLHTELRWATAVLERHKEPLREFRRLADQVGAHVLQDEFSEAIDVLNAIENEWGVSLWSLQLRIALTNEASGLEAQKTVVAEARAVFDRGLLGYIAYHIGVRNESRTTASRFTATTETRIAKHPSFSKEVKTYLRHVIIGEFPTSLTGMAEVLRVSQSHHFFDLYEDMVLTLQALCLDQVTQEVRAAIADFLRIFSILEDFRLPKIAFVLDRALTLSGVQVQGNNILDAILQERSRDAFREFTRSTQHRSQPNPWDFIYVGWAASEGQFKEPKEKRIVRRCVRFVAATFTNTDLFDPHDAIIKISRNFGQIPFFRSLSSYSELINGSGFPRDLDYRIIGLNSPRVGYEDLSPEQILSTSSGTNQAQPATIDVWRAFAGQAPQERDPMGVLSLSYSLGRALRREIEIPRREPPDINRRTLGARYFFEDVIALLDADEAFDKAAVLEVVASACSEAYHSPFRHKISNVLRGYGWEDFRQCSDPIIRSVAIHLAWEASFDSRIRSVLRFSIKDFFRQESANLPSELEWRDLDVPNSILVYFLAYVCTPDVLDILTELRGTRQVLSERAGICLMLQDIDPENRRYYAEEYAAVQEEISFSEGQLIVDSSRIYVETPQLRQWAKTNLAEDYSRYRDLARVDIEDTQPFDELLREIRTGRRDVSASFTAKSEADIILFGILTRLRDEFLTNSSFGLDFFLSKRIRHQSFIGSIRAPLEHEELITNRSDEESEYKPNYQWVNRLSVHNNESRSALLKSFERFSEDFDAELISAKDKYFQINSKEFPGGLVFLPLTSNIVSLTKSLTPIDYNFEDFLDTAIAFIWIGLEPSLAIIRGYIKDELKEKIIALIDKLRREVKEAIGPTTEFLEFDANIGQRSREVQVKLDECAGWFARTNLDFTESSFELEEAVGMAQSFALSCLPGFEPEIDQPSIEANTRLRAPSLVHLHDQILIALQNAKDHSGLRKPRISMFAYADASEGVLSIRVESEIKPSLVEKARQDADERKEMIAEGQSSLQTRREGGSGFFKLAAVAAQSSRGKIDFGVSLEDRFFLEVQYSLVMEVAT